MDPFLWGIGGQRISPEEQQVAQALVDFSPVADPMQGVARMANVASHNWQQAPQNQFPDQPGGNTFMGGLMGLGTRLFGGGGGLY